MTRLDWFLAGLGPLAILLVWAFLPGGVPEGSRSAEVAPSGVVAELVGYTVDAGQDGRPYLLGSGREADVRLHKAPIARRAAFLLPPHATRPSWAVVPARPDLTLRLVGESSTVPDARRLRETSWRPWSDDGPGFPFFDADRAAAVTLGCADPVATIAAVRLRQLRLWGPGSDHLAEPEVLWLETETRVAASGAEARVDVVSCPNGRVWWRPRDAAPGEDPCAGQAEGWKRARSCWIGRPAVCTEPFNRTWGARIRQGTETRLHTPWGDRFEAGTFHVDLGKGALSSIRLGLDTAAVDPGCRGAPCDPRAMPICRSGSDEPVETLGALKLRDGDLLGIGRTRFLVRLEDGPESGGLELLHVRSPRAPGYFRASAGHDVYHPNRRAMWSVPACEAREDELTLLVRPRDGADQDKHKVAELALHDRKVRQQIDAAAQHRGVPHEVPAVTAAGLRPRALLSLCTVRGSDGEVHARLRADAPRRGISVRTSDGGSSRHEQEDGVDVALGTRRKPREAMLEMDGNLIRVAPVANGRVTRHVRRGLAFYLVFVLVLQAVPLTLARQALRRRKTPWTEEETWPADLGTPTLQQMAGTGIVVLLFVGASFQLFLALHPELAGKPDYAQAFLQGVVVVSTALAAAAGFAVGTGRQVDLRLTLPLRLACAALAASLSLLGAALWWWLDSGGVPDGFWLTALRNQATASSGAGPEAFGKLLLQGAGAGLVLALVLFVSDRLDWPRLAEWTARRGLRVPVAGFVVLAAGGLSLGVLQSSALAFELGILAGLAWYAGVYWAFVRRGRLLREDRLRRRAALYSLSSGILILAFLVVFFLVGADLPDPVSFACVVLGLGITGLAVKIMVSERFTSLLRVLLLWGAASAFGAGFASLVLTDMGSVAAWIPAVLAGLFLWLVRPEEQGSRTEEPKKAKTHLLLALGLGLVLMGVLDVFKTLVQGLEWQALDRPRQRLDLADDVSYITAGEWVTQVRWLASHQDGDFQWVPNVNSDVAVFGLAAGVGTWLAILASIVVLAVAGCAVLAADHALREGHATAARSQNDRLYPALYRGLGLLMGMTSVLLIAQWLVHLATGVVLHLPITGLVFPWISHGNTTHLLYAAAIVVPMAAITALGGRVAR